MKPDRRFTSAPIRPERGRSLAPLAALVLIVSLVALPLTTGCGSVSKTAYNSLTTLKAAYVTAKASRTEYCAPKVPQPKICADSYQPLLAGYEALKTGSALLETYVLTNDADAKEKLKAFLPVILGQTIEILKLAIGDPAATPPPPEK